MDCLASVKQTRFVTWALWISIAAVLFVPLAQQVDGADPIVWRYTFDSPPEKWQDIDFNDGSWNEGPGGFGEASTPGSRVGTPWTNADIWLRRTIELPAIPKRLALQIHHDEDAEVYLNGQLVLKRTGFVSDYQIVPLDGTSVSAARIGRNVLAVHCHQTRGGQYIDVHLVDADNIPPLPPVPQPEFPFKSELITPWGAEVTAENAWAEYPRPALQRTEWTNLNGKWDYAVTPTSTEQAPTKWDGEILVPFALESKLSGVQRLLHTDQALWYHREFLYQPKEKQRTLLHFEAVDYRCQVWINGVQLGDHVGGNVPFALDATSALRTGRNEIVVRVEDATEGYQLNGKQHLRPEGIWYTQVSGIWQTVWLEAVAPDHFVDLQVSTDAMTGTIQIDPLTSRNEGRLGTVQAIVRDGEREVARSTGKVGKLQIVVPNPQLWSPANPHLYELEVTLFDGNGVTLDTVQSYAGIRTVGRTQDSSGHWRLTLNGQPIFHWGPLDQGWWPDGLLTPPSDAAMRSDIDFLKAAGFNMIRKHIKVEPRRYYYHCDRVGMMLWQDQVSGGTNPPWTRLAPNPQDATWSDQHHEQFMREFAAMVDVLDHHPCIVMWVPFNEAWGQHRTVEVGKWIKTRDPSRTVNIASGGNFWPVGDVVDEHRYPHPGFPFDPSRDRDFVMVMGEFGGHGLPVPGHLWDASRRNWGYGDLPKNGEEYRSRYVESIRLLNELRRQGIAAGVYTQTTDVEGEINGLMTYDRKVQKLSPTELKTIHQSLFE